ncbi:putative leucine-rich repeat receptor-like serine/threonine-protein kinase At2g24130 [Durio zibethinus]|uniref:Leucine-rich repeat receptor-like serine/threonine-protein kinase At2g24130 n=1 Tax=Durio zibethinus TaxID=66656 RepID=A0A6P5WLA2_DURZI|nr:putative leucine-rich repeat receptor-like serine/threonine-protein kinase At2g24130 [Durio zibethinus]
MTCKGKMDEARKLTEIIASSVCLVASQREVSSALACDSAYLHHLHHSLLKDKAALLAFKESILVDPNSKLTNWEEVVPVCNFTGVTCNHFFGTIPPELSSLQRLQILRLNRNNLSGPIPDSFVLLTNLTLYEVSENKLTGPLPPSFFSNCTQLQNIDLSFNYIRGQIPAEIGNCPNLWTVNLFNNQLTGQLPTSLTNITLYNLDVNYNLLSGELLTDIVQKPSCLAFLHLSYNNMTSHDNNTNLYPFFATLGNCTYLTDLELAGMGLGGTLPSTIGHPRLKCLELQENHIFGSIPPEIGNLSNITVPNLASNFLNGTIPEEVSLLLNLEQLLLSHNFFSFRIPVALGKLPHLGQLDLSNNKFSGEIPSNLGDLDALLYLFLNNNLLSGTIPPKLLKCINLYMPDLSHNRLTGRVPPEIAELHEMRRFINFSHNLLEGPLPIALNKLENVQEVDLSSNNLGGNIFCNTHNPTSEGCVDNE